MILYPKMKNRFRVLYESQDSAKNEQYLDLTLQTVSVSPLVQNNMPGAYTGGTVSTVIEDDITNKACNALQALMKDEDFTIRIQYLDGTEQVAREYTLLSCRVTEVVHDEANYALSDGRSYIEFDGLWKALSKIPAPNLSPEWEAVLNVLGSTRVVMKEPAPGSQVLRKEVYFTYRDMKIS